MAMSVLENRWHEQRVMSAFVKVHRDFIFRVPEMRRGIHHVAKDVLGLGGLETIADFCPQETVEATGHHGEEHVAVDFHEPL